MLRAVVLIGTAHVFNQRSQHDVKNENQDLEAAFDEIFGHYVERISASLRGGDNPLDPLPEPDRPQNEEKDGKADSQQHGNRDDDAHQVDFQLFRHPFFKSGGLAFPVNLGGTRQNFRAGDERIEKSDASADDRQAQKPVALPIGLDAL